MDNKSMEQKRKYTRKIDPELAHRIDENTIFQTLCDQLELYCIDNKIDDMRTESESAWQAFLQWANMLLFAKNYKADPLDNKNSFLLYNDDALYIVCQWFTLYSRKYGKTCNPYSFSILSGIELANIYMWRTTEININTSNINDSNINNKYSAADGRLVTYKRQLVAKTLFTAYEESLAAGLTTGKNPVGIIATLNRRFGWNNAEMVIKSQPQIVSAADLPVLEPPKSGQ